MRRYIYIWPFLVLPLCLQGQDPQFSQFYSSPIYLNPGFAGNTVQGRFVLNYRNQWPALAANFVSYAASFDYNFHDLNSGLAVAMQQDRAGTANLRYTNLAIHYAYTLRLTRKLALKPGMYLSYTTRDIDYTKLVFGDQLIYDNPASLSTTQFNQERIRYPDIGTGIIGYMRNWWAGMSFHHINQPTQSFIFQETKLPMRFSLHGGYNYVLKRSVKNKQITGLTGVFNYKSQGKWDQVDFGAYLTFKIITAGIFYRGIPLFKQNSYGYPNQDAVTALLGLELEEFAIGYTYDLTVSRLISNSGGAHEISIRYEFANERLKRRRSKSRTIIPCAKF